MERMLESLRQLLEHFLLRLLVLVFVCCLHEARHNVNGDWENYCAIVLCGYTVQGLEIPQLKEIRLIILMLISLLPEELLDYP